MWVLVHVWCMWVHDDHSCPLPIPWSDHYIRNGSTITWIIRTLKWWTYLSFQSERVWPLWVDSTIWQFVSSGDQYQWPCSVWHFAYFLRFKSQTGSILHVRNWPDRPSSHIRKVKRSRTLISIEVARGRWLWLTYTRLWQRSMEGDTITHTHIQKHWRTHTHQSRKHKHTNTPQHTHRHTHTHTHTDIPTRSPRQYWHTEEEINRFLGWIVRVKTHFSFRKWINVYFSFQWERFVRLLLFMTKTLYRSVCETIWLVYRCVRQYD